MDSKRIKTLIIAGFILFAVCSLAIGLLSGQGEGPDPVQAASAEINTNTSFVSVQIATPTPIGTVAPTATTIVATTKATPVPTTVKQTVAPTQTKVVTPTPTVTVSTPKKATTKNVDLYIVSEFAEPYNAQPFEGFVHGVVIGNRGSEDFNGVVSLSFTSEQKGGTVQTSIRDVKVSAQGTSKVSIPPKQGGSDKNSGNAGITIISYG